MTTICEHIDFNDLARRIHQRDTRPMYGISRIEEAIDRLRDLPFADGYLDGLRYDVLNAFLKHKKRNEWVSVYLAFYGDEDRAKFLKIGIAANVKSRLLGIRTGNPLPNVSTYAATLDTRREAAAIESVLLRNMAPDGVHGEWIDVHGVALPAIDAIVRSLEELASSVSGRRVSFVPLGVIA